MKESWKEELNACNSIDEISSHFAETLLDAINKLKVENNNFASIFPKDTISWKFREYLAAGRANNTTDLLKFLQYLVEKFSELDGSYDFYQAVVANMPPEYCESIDKKVSKLPNGKPAAQAAPPPEVKRMKNSLPNQPPDLTQKVARDAARHAAINLVVKNLNRAIQNYNPSAGVNNENNTQIINIFKIDIFKSNNKLAENTLCNAFVNYATDQEPDKISLANFLSVFLNEHLKTKAPLSDIEPCADMLYNALKQHEPQFGEQAFLTCCCSVAPQSSLRDIKDNLKFYDVSSQIKIGYLPGAEVGQVQLSQDRLTTTSHASRVQAQRDNAAKNNVAPSARSAPFS